MALAAFLAAAATMSSLLAGCARPVSEKGRPSSDTMSALRVQSLCFSPAGDLLAIVTEQGESVVGAEGPKQRRLYVVAASKRERPKLARACASQSAAWIADPTETFKDQLVFAAIEEQKAHLQVWAQYGDHTYEERSPELHGSVFGAISAKGSSAAIVVGRPDGRFELYLWHRMPSALAHWEIPAAFVPSLEAPPVMSAERDIVAIVSNDGGSFLGFDTRSESWLVPVTIHELTWQWQDYVEAKAGEDLWQSGAPSDFGQDKFMVDEKAAALWVVSIEVPVGAVRTPTGFAVLPVDQLCPLDIESRKGLRSDRGHAVGFSVWLYYLLSISSAEGFGRVAALYGTGSPANCWVHELSGVPRVRLIEDESLPSQALSLSDDGSRLALVRGTADDQSVHVLDVNAKRALLSYRLSSLASTPATPPSSSAAETR